jgi:hypothetical protein
MFETDWHQWVLYAVIFACSLWIFFHNFSLVIFRYSSRTPFLIKVGTVFIAIGSLTFLLNPLACGASILVGYIIVIVADRRTRPPKEQTSHG